VRALQQEQDPLERLQILLGHVQHEPAATSRLDLDLVGLG
jgi:hypothetical protein